MECGECTLCCKLLETHGVESKRGVYCKYCFPDIGCSIHEKRPNECRQYQCMWSQMENVGIDLRPDKSHIIFDKVNDKIISAQQDPDYELNKLVKDQIDFFMKEGFSVILIKNFDKMVYLAKGHSFDEVKETFIKYIREKESKINGSKLY